MMVYTKREAAFYQFCVGYYKAGPSTTVKGLAGPEAKEQLANYTPQFLDEEIVPTSDEIIEKLEGSLGTLKTQIEALKLAVGGSKNTGVSPRLELTINAVENEASWTTSYLKSTWSAKFEGVVDTSAAIDILWPYVDAEKKEIRGVTKNFYASSTWGEEKFSHLLIVPNTDLGRDVLIATDKLGCQYIFCLECENEMCVCCNRCHVCDQGVNCEKNLALGNTPQELT